MKFYYKGNLVRTSKTHFYKYGVFSKSNKCLACATSYELAQKAVANVTRLWRNDVEFYQEEIKAINAGKDKFWYHNKICKVTDSLLDCEDRIDNCFNIISGIHIEELTQVE